MPNLQVFQELKKTNSVVEKEDILRKYQDDEQLQKLLELNLNPYILLQFNKMPCTFNELTSFDKFEPRTNYFCFIRLCDELNKRKFTGNEAKREVIDVFKRMLRDEFEVYSKILLKEAIGVGAKTVNKVWPGLVPEFALMLAPNDLPDITKVKYPTTVQPKLDGFRCVYRDGEFWTRAGRPFPNVNLKEHFKSVYNLSDWVLDGEMYDHTINFNKLSSILNNETAPIPSTVKFSVYDCLSIKDWDNQTTKKEYQYRLQDLRVALSIISDYKKVIDVATDTVTTSKEVKDLYKKYLDKGYEGVMLKDPTGLYKWKRTTVKSGEMLKVKPFETLDLVITGIYAGEGNFEGMAGGIDVDYNGVTVSVGSGFDMATRKKLSATPNDYIGKTVEIKYFEETEDGSLRFPIFVRFREDKS